MEVTSSEQITISSNNIKKILRTLLQSDLIFTISNIIHLSET